MRVKTSAPLAIFSTGCVPIVPAGFGIAQQACVGSPKNSPCWRYCERQFSPPLAIFRPYREPIYLLKFRIPLKECGFAEKLAARALILVNPNLLRAVSSTKNADEGGEEVEQNGDLAEVPI